MKKETKKPVNNSKQLASVFKATDAFIWIALSVSLFIITLFILYEIPGEDSSHFWKFPNSWKLYMVIVFFISSAVAFALAITSMILCKKQPLKGKMTTKVYIICSAIFASLIFLGGVAAGISVIMGKGEFYDFGCLGGMVMFVGALPEAIVTTIAIKQMK